MGFSNLHEPAYTIFVDEAGDPGIRAVGRGAATEWFTIGLVVIDHSRAPETIDWVREIKREVRQDQKPFFHYKDVLPGARRLRVAEMLASKPCRAFVVASHKPNMAGYSNPRPEGRGGQHVFYNWVLRVALERATQWIRHRSLQDHKEVRKARLIMSSAGGLDYSQLKAYHELLRMQGRNAYLNANTIAWDVLSQSLYEAVPARSNAGVQLADIVASAFYQAAHVDGPHWDLAPALALKKIMPARGGIAANCSMVLMPLKRSQQRLDADRRQLFEAFGYRF
jgi:hypothetical protein